MDIEPTDIYHQQVFLVLKKIKHQYNLSGDTKFAYNLRLIPLPRKNELDSTTEQEIINNLKKENIFRVLETYPTFIGEEENPKFAFHTIQFDISEPKFSDFFDKYRFAFENSNKSRFTLLKDGTATLFTNGKRFTYTFRTKTDSFRVLKLLIANKGETVSFEEISMAIRNKNKDTSDERKARNAIDYIRKCIGYSGEDFIKTDYGFQLVCNVNMKG